MIRIADYTEELDRLKNFRPEDARREFNRICFRLFGATIDDIRSNDYARMKWFTGDLYDKLNPDYCRSLGYDLIIRDRVRVTYAEEFAAMIVAQSEGLLPKTAEERLQRRREEEATLAQRRREEEDGRAQRRLEEEAARFLIGKSKSR